MRLDRPFAFAALCAAAFAGAASAEPRHAPRIPLPARTAPQPAAPSPQSWSEAEVQRMMNEMSRDMNAMMAGPAWGPLGFDLGFGDMGWGLGLGAGMGMGMGMPGFSGMGGPLMGSPFMSGPAGASSSWATSSEDDGNGHCRRTMSASRSATGQLPQSVSRSDNVCDPSLMAGQPDPDDDLDADEPDDEEPEGGR